MGIDRYNMVQDLILKHKEELHYTLEDEKLLLKLWDAYWKKKKGDLRGDPAVLACAVLWRYSSDNFLWQYHNQWMQKVLAELFGVRGKTVGNNASDISKVLKIKYFDDRFCRKEVAEKNPLRSMAMLPSGFIINREMAEEKNLPFVPLQKRKEDYLYDGLDCLEDGDERAALYRFKKALEIDDEFVDAYNALGQVYWEDDLVKAKKYFEKAYELTRKKFREWPEKLEWGVLENRQYLRAVEFLGLVLWEEGNVDGAKEKFSLLLKLNPNDNQGARFVLAALYKKLSWENFEESDAEEILVEMNEKFGFWRGKE